MPYLRCMCLLAHSGIQHILRCDFALFFFRLVYPMLQVSLDYQFYDCPFSIL